MEDLVSRLNDLGYVVSVKKKYKKNNIIIIEIFSKNNTRSKAIKSNSIKVYFLRANSKSATKKTAKILTYYINIINKNENPFKFHTIDLINLLNIRACYKCYDDYNKKNYIKIIFNILFFTFLLIFELLRAYNRIQLNHMLLG